MTEHFSADTDDLDAFVSQAADDDRQMAAVEETLTRQRAYLSSLPLPYFVERSQIEAYRQLRGSMAENGRWVAAISSALKLWGADVDGADGSRYRAPVELIDAQLDKSIDELVDEVTEQLVADGFSPEEAKRLRTEIDNAIDANPALSLHDAVLAGQRPMRASRSRSCCVDVELSSSTRPMSQPLLAITTRPWPASLVRTMNSLLTICVLPSTTTPVPPVTTKVWPLLIFCMRTTLTKLIQQA